VKVEPSRREGRASDNGRRPRTCTPLSARVLSREGEESQNNRYKFQQLWLRRLKKLLLRSANAIWNAEFLSCHPARKQTKPVTSLSDSADQRMEKFSPPLKTFSDRDRRIVE